MMQHEDWVAAIEAGYEVGFSIPVEEMPERDDMDRGDERHQAWVIGLDSGRAARVAADSEEAEHLAFFTEHIRPVVDRTVADMGRGTPEQRQAVQRARAAELAASNRAAARPLVEPYVSRPRRREARELSR